MVLKYCKQCKGAIHIKTKYRNYLPTTKINGRPYGRRLHKDDMCTCSTPKESLEEENQQKILQNILHYEDNNTIQNIEHLNVLEQIKKLLLVNIKISKKTNRNVCSHIYKNDSNT